MAKLRINGDSSGYVDLEAPNAASSSTLDLDQVPQKNATTTGFTGNMGVGISTPSTTASGYDGGNLHVHNSGTGSSLRLTNSTTGTGTSSGMLISKWSDSNTYLTNFDNGANTIFTQSNSSGTLQTTMKFDGNGVITTPNQPSWNLRPNTSSNVTHNTDIIGWTTNAFLSSSALCHLQGVTLSGSSGGVAGATSSGRINFPVAGTYKVWITFRYENSTGPGNIYLRYNGTNIARQHVEVWGRYNYAHGFMSQVIRVSAGDYIEWQLASGGNGIFGGYNDTVNWCGGYLIG